MHTISLANIRTKEQIIHLREQHKRGEVRIIDDNYASIAMGALANGHIGSFQSFAVLSAGHEWLKNTLLTMDLKSMSGDGCFMSDGQITLQNPGNCDQVPSRRLFSEDFKPKAFAERMCGCKDGVDALFSGTTKHRALVTYKGEHFTEAMSRGVDWIRHITEEVIVLMSALVMEPACGGWWADTTNQVVNKYGYDKVDRLNPRDPATSDTITVVPVMPSLAGKTIVFDDAGKPSLTVTSGRPIRVDVNISGRDISATSDVPIRAFSIDSMFDHAQDMANVVQMQMGDAATPIQRYAAYEIDRTIHNSDRALGHGAFDASFRKQRSEFLDRVTDARTKPTFFEAVQTVYPNEVIPSAFISRMAEIVNGPANRGEKTEPNPLPLMGYKDFIAIQDSRAKTQKVAEEIGDESTPVHKYASYELARVEQEVAKMQTSGIVDHARLDELGARLDRIDSASTKADVLEAIEAVYPGSSSDLKSQVFAAANIHGKAF